MERDQVLYGLIGVGIGLTFGWLLWRFRALSRDAAVALQSRLDTAERRLSGSEESREEAEVRIEELDQALKGERKVLDGILAVTGELPEPLFGFESDGATTSDKHAESSVPDVAGLAHLTSDQERVHTLAERLAQSQAWLEESEDRVNELEARLAAHDSGESDSRRDDAEVERIESRLALTREALVAADARVQSLTGELADRDSAIAATRQSIQLIKQQASEAGNSLEGVIDLRSHGDATPEASMSTSQLLSLRQAEVTALRRKVESIEGDVEEKSEALHQRQSELVAQLEQAQVALDLVGDAPERAAQLQEEVARLRALVADHSIERDRLGSQLHQRDAIDAKLDALFVEIHELRGRSAALRSGIRQPGSAMGNSD